MLQMAFVARSMQAKPIPPSETFGMLETVSLDWTATYARRIMGEDSCLDWLQHVPAGVTIWSEWYLCQSQSSGGDQVGNESSAMNAVPAVPSQLMPQSEEACSIFMVLKSSAATLWTNVHFLAKATKRIQKRASHHTSSTISDETEAPAMRLRALGLPKE